MVSSVGEDVRGLAPGDRVLAMPGWGGMAETIKVAATACTRLPETMSFEHAATLMAGYLWHRSLRVEPACALEVGRVAARAGRRVGSVWQPLNSAVRAAHEYRRGLHSAELELHWRAARRPASFIRQAKRRAIRRRFRSPSRSIGRAGRRCLLDPVGDVYSEPALRSVSWGGRYLVIGFAAGAIPKIPLNLPLLKGCDIQGALFGAHAQREPQAVQEEIRELFDLYARGVIQPYVSHASPLRRADLPSQKSRRAAHSASSSS